VQREVCLRLTGMPDSDAIIIAGVAKLLQFGGGRENELFSTQEGGEQLSQRSYVLGVALRL
jgi:hypothetical protein